MDDATRKLRARPLDGFASGRARIKEIETPRDRKGELEPPMVRKNQTRWTGFDDDKILSMY